MNDSQAEIENLRQELAEVKEHLRLTEETLQAIHSGEVDAVVVSTKEGERIFTLQGADHVYQLLIEQMGEGAATVSDDGLILYSNKRLSELLNCPLKKLIGSELETFITPKDRKALSLLLQKVKKEETRTIELSLITVKNHQEIPVKLSVKQFNVNELVINSIVITDITESKIKEATKINQILNSAVAVITNYRAFPDGTWIVDYWSQGCELLVGYTAEEFMADQNLWASRIYPEDLETVVTQAFEDYKFKKTSSLEYRFYHKDGTLLWLTASIFFEWDEMNNCWNGTGILTDITPRKQSEIVLQGITQERLITNIAQKIRETLDLDQVLQTTVEEVQELFKADRVLIYRFNPDGNGTVIAESLEGEWTSMLSQVFHDDYCTEHYFTFSQADFYARTDIYELEPCFHKFFEPFQVKASLTIPITHAKHLWGYLIVHQCSGIRQWQTTEIELLQQLAIQVSIAIQQSELYQQTRQELIERKKAESKISEQAALIDISTDAIFVHDLDDQILFWSKGAERLYGWTETEVLGYKSQFLFNQDNNITEAIQTTIEQGSWEGELEQITKTGKKIIVTSHKTLVENQFSQLKSILVVNSDITEKKQLEKQFYHIQRLESLGTLASGIAHDFNNILTPILGVTEMLPMQFPNLNDRTQHLLTLLYISARRGADLVKQILLFSRSTEGKQVTLQLGYVLMELIGIIKQTFPKSIKIVSEMKTMELQTISADATQMHQIFMNLMVNARDAMLDGGTLTIYAQNRQLDSHYARMNLEAKEGCYVVVAISDTGMGIPPDLLERIFDPFFTTKDVGKGTGLGLSTVRGIVKNHGGFIRVYSELGKSTKFEIFLPAINGEESLTTEAEVIPKGNDELILIVDDEASIQEITKIALESYNYRTLTANDGREALSVYVQNQQELSVVLMDLIMPNLDGITTIRILQQINPEVKIIATSGLIGNSKLALEADVKTFLLKPYTIKQLLETLRILIHT